MQNGLFVLHQNISGLEQEKTNYTSVFPNPIRADEWLTISTNKKMLVSIELFNSIGELMKSEFISSTDKTLKLKMNGLEAGIYFLHLRSKEGCETQKIMLH